MFSIQYCNEKSIDTKILHIFLLLFQLQTLRGIPVDKNTSKIDVNGVRKYKSVDRFGNATSMSAEEAIGWIEYLKIFQIDLSKQLPPERYNGIINLIYITLYPNATRNEIEGGLVNISKIQCCFAQKV